MLYRLGVVLLMRALGRKQTLISWKENFDECKIVNTIDTFLYITPRISTTQRHPSQPHPDLEPFNNEKDKIE